MARHSVGPFTADCDNLARSNWHRVQQLAGIEVVLVRTEAKEG